MTRMWVVDVIRFPAYRFTSLVAASAGLTCNDAAEYAKKELISYGRTSAGQCHTSWQEAWNHLTEATPQQAGYLTVRNPACRRCDGRGFSFTGNSIMQSLQRGLPKGTCPECQGNRRTATIRFPAIYAEVTAAQSA